MQSDDATRSYLERVTVANTAVLNSQGQLVADVLNNLRTSRKLLTGNTAELEEAFAELQDMLRHGKKFLMSDDELAEVNRRLFNWTMTRSMLVDHTRASLARLDMGEGTKWHQDIYIPRLRPLQVPAFAFLKDLRNYIAHCQSVETHQRFRRLPDGQIDPIISVRDELLRRWKGWSADSKRFLKSSDSIDLRMLVEDYKQVVDDFYEWLEGAIRERHAGDLAETERLRKKRAHLATEDFADEPWFASLRALFDGSVDD